jgi:hypothetical protein
MPILLYAAMWARSSECSLNLWNRMPMMPEGEPWDQTWRVESPVGMPGFSIASHFAPLKYFQTMPMCTREHGDRRFACSCQL